MWLILGLCLAARLSFFALVHPWDPQVEQQVVLQSDALGYHQLATTMLRHGRFATEGAGEAEALRTPGYPVFVATVYALVGVRPWAVLLVQAVVDTIACGVLFLALSHCVAGRPASVAAALYALNPLCILYSSTLMSDVLFVGLCIGAFFWWMRAMTAPSPGRRAAIGYGLSSLTMGLATLVRPVALYVLVPMLAFVLIAHRRDGRHAVAYAGVYLLGFTLALSPWLWRNHQEFGRWALSTSGDYNLLRLYVAPMEAARRQQDVNTVRAALMQEAEARLEADGLPAETLTPFDRFAYCRRVAVDYIRARPGSFARSTALGLVHTLTSLNTSTYAETLGRRGTVVELKGQPVGVGLVGAFLQRKSPTELVVAALVAPYMLLCYATAVVGAVVAWRRHPQLRLLAACALLAAYFILVTGAAGLARFKMPAIPFYLAFSGIGLTVVLERLKRPSAPDSTPEPPG